MLIYVDFDIIKLTKCEETGHKKVTTKDKQVGINIIDTFVLLLSKC